MEYFRFTKYESYKFYDYGLQTVLIRKNLALNRHWYDVLLDYSPTTLVTDFFLHDFSLSKKNAEHLDLSKLIHLKIKNLSDDETWLLHGYEESLDVFIVSMFIFTVKMQSVILTVNQRFLF